MNSVQNLIIFIGPPGSGKGSIARYCVDEFAWKQLSTGNLCRKHILEQTEFGKTIDFAIKSGKLIPDEVIIQIVDEWWASQGRNASGIILDGYPRTLVQANLFDEYVKKQLSNIRLTIVRLVVSDNQIVERLTQRFICKNHDCQAVYSNVPSSLMMPKQFMKCDYCNFELYRRADDEEMTVRERLRIYHKHEGQLLEFYKNVGYSIFECNGERPIQDIFSEFKQTLGFARI